MDATVEPRTEPQLDAALIARIVELSADPTPEAFPPATLNEPLELTMRRRAERRFQEARASRTWWRLTGEERAQIAAVVMARNPWFYKRPDRLCPESDCCSEILRVLDNARHGA